MTPQYNKAINYYNQVGTSYEKTLAHELDATLCALSDDDLAELLDWNFRFMMFDANGSVPEIRRNTKVMNDHILFIQGLRA